MGEAHSREKERERGRLITLYRERSSGDGLSVDKFGPYHIELYLLIEVCFILVFISFYSCYFSLFLNRSSLNMKWPKMYWSTTSHTEKNWKTVSKAMMKARLPSHLSTGPPIPLTFSLQGKGFICWRFIVTQTQTQEEK